MGRSTQQGSSTVLEGPYGGLRFVRPFTGDFQYVKLTPYTLEETMKLTRPEDL